MKGMEDVKMTERTIVAGTRGSKLALAQTKWVCGEVGCEIRTDIIKTRGDIIQDVPLARLEGKAFFTKEIDDALLDGSIDLAVHSFKDVPTELPENMVVAAIPPREDPRDALLVGPTITERSDDTAVHSDFSDGIMDEDSSGGGVEGQFDAGMNACAMGAPICIGDLPGGIRVGTSSLRRAAILRHLNPGVHVTDLRGNLDTRIRKLMDGEYDAIVVAMAGLHRLGYVDEAGNPLEGTPPVHPLDPLEFPPATGQGALAITARADDSEALELLSRLEDPFTRKATESERRFLATLQGGCQVPAGVYTRITPGPDGGLDTGRIEMAGFVATLDGKTFIREQVECEICDALSVAEGLARTILERGGAEILERIRAEAPPGR